jgi:ABC-type transport system involved in multi-copper enzyme maturation permease subunit
MSRIWTQTAALFVDAYRQLNSKKMFWVCLIINAVIVLVFLAIGVTDSGNLSFLWFKTPIPLYMSRAELYVTVFNNFGIGFWLAFVGTILALVSTAGIFPDWITAGSIDLYLSKSISRLRLFFTKYLSGLLFVTLQVAVFSAASFLVIGIRGGVWAPGVFLAVPLVVCLFSYLYSVCVLLGLMTRSTVAAILLTMVFWFVLWGLDRADATMVFFEQVQRVEADNATQQIAEQRAGIEADKKKFATTKPTTRQLANLTQREEELKQLTDEHGSDAHGLSMMRRIHAWVLDTKTFLPKTRETTSLLDRCLPKQETWIERQARDSRESARDSGPQFGNQEVAVAAQKELESRSVWWIIGWSLVFEAVVLALAGWKFCRRDY